MIVVDASAILEVLLRTPEGEFIEARLLGSGESLHAPHLIDLEVAQVLRRYAGAGEFDAMRARVALEDLADLRISRYRHDVLLFRIWELRRNFSAYDAAYVGLAEALDAPLVTHDRRLTRAKGHNARIELI